MGVFVSLFGCGLVVNSVGHFTLIIDVVYCDLVVSSYLIGC